MNQFSGSSLPGYSGSQAISALVLGGAGFIGQHLLDHLIKRPEFPRIQVAGSRVSQLSRFSGLAPIEDTVDATLLQACTRPDVIFWAIGGSSVGLSLKDPDLDFKLSIPPLVALLDQMRGPWEGAHLIFLSSAAVYGQSGSLATSTSSTLLPISPYGNHKKKSEELILDAVATNGISSTIVRPFSVYGPGLRRQLFWDALRKQQFGDLRFHGGGDELRDWVYIDDLIALLIDIALSPKKFASVINAGTGAGITVSSALNCLLATVSSTESAEFSGSVRAGDPDRLVACPIEQQGLSRYFNTPLNEGLGHYVNWYSKEN